MTNMNSKSFFVRVYKSKRNYYAKATMMLMCSSIVYHSQGFAMSPSTSLMPHSFNAKANIEDAMQIQAIKTVELVDKNQLWFYENEDLEIISIGISFEGCGHTKDLKNKPGLMQLLAAYFDDAGAGIQDRITFQKDLLAKAIQFTFVAHADRLEIRLQCKSKDVVYALQKLRDVLTKPRFDEETLTVCKQKVIASYQQSLHEPTTIAKEKFIPFIMGEDHIYVKSTENKLRISSSAEVIDIKAQFDHAVKRGKMYIAAAGKADLQILQSALNDFISAIPKGEEEEIVQDGELKNEGQILFVQSVNPQSVVLFAHPYMPKSDPDYFASVVLLSILGKTPFESRLWQEVREKRGLTYGISVDRYFSARKYALVGSLATVPASVDESIEIIKSVWEKTANEGVNDKELKLHKNYLLGAYPLQFNKTSSIVSLLLNNMQDGYEANQVTEQMKQISAVTLSDVNRVAKKLLHAEKLRFLILGPSVAKANVADASHEEVLNITEGKDAQ